MTPTPTPNRYGYMHPRPIPGAFLCGIGEVFAARPADLFEREGATTFFIVYTSEPGRYEVALLNMSNGLHFIEAYEDCGEAYDDYGARKYEPAPDNA